MSNAASRANAGAESRIERWQHWIAAVTSALLHVSLLLLALWPSPVTVTPPQGGDAGSRMAVDFIGAAPPQPIPAIPLTKPAPNQPAAKRPAAPRMQSTVVMRADDPLPPDDPDDEKEGQTQAPGTPPPPAPQRRAPTWGQPPGMLPQETAPENVGLTRGPAVERGRGSGTSAAEPRMEVGGYQVYYDLRGDARLRAWRDQGMTEVFLPLPGTRRYMVCPLETALRRESGPCRLLEPDSPELATIGDAREVIDMQQVYRQGERVWSGPGPYR